MSRWISAALVTVALSGLMQIVSIVSAPPAWGCSCIGPVTSTDHYRAADAVFTGTVIDRIRSSSRGGDPTITVLFNVTQIYKGDVGATQSVVSLGGGAGGVVTSCDINHRSAQRWLVYAENHGRRVEPDVEITHADRLAAAREPAGDRIVQPAPHHRPVV